MSVSPDDLRFMRRAIALSKRGFPAPNPHVGCVLVRGGQIIGEGYHHHAGGGHAEVEALRDAKGDTKGATAYVTLEPCNHFGRTPPCSQALLQAGVARVVVACADPNPNATGGAEALRQAGVEVEGGVLTEEAARANEMFLFAMAHRRPFIVAKAAMSLDGRIALPSGESQWITGPAARRAAHRLRAECGAVLVGRRTVELDDPELTARIPGVVNQPVRIVLDPNARLKGTEKVFNQKAPTRHITGEIDLPSLLVGLFEAGIHGLLVEGGGVTLASFFRARLVDRLELFVGGKVLGDGPAWLTELNLNNLAEAPMLTIERMVRLGPDLRLTARPQWPSV